MMLNLCCGTRKKPGYINVDKQWQCEPDVICDLEKEHWPWGDSSIEAIDIIHGLEHLGATVDSFFHIMKELYRVCEPGALINIVVPHPRSEGFQGDPTHVRMITPSVMSLFSKAEAKLHRDRGFPNTPICEYIGVDFYLIRQEYSLMPEWDHRYKNKTITDDELRAAVDSYFNVVCEINMVLRVVK